MQLEEVSRVDAGEEAGAQLHGRDEYEKEDLAIELGTAEIARDPAVDAEVDHGGEGPDILGCGKEAVHSGDSGDGEVDGKSKVLVVQEGGDGEEGSSGHGGDRTDEDAEEDGGFEGEIGGEEVLYVEADEDAEGERDTDHGDQSCGLAPIAMGIEEEFFECGTAGQDGGEGRGYA